MELRRPYELAEGKRLTVGPCTADYGDTSDLFKMLWRIVEGIADSIVEKRAHGDYWPPLSSGGSIPGATSAEIGRKCGRAGHRMMFIRQVISTAARATTGLGAP